VRGVTRIVTRNLLLCSIADALANVGLVSVSRKLLIVLNLRGGGEFRDSKKGLT